MSVEAPSFQARRAPPCNKEIELVSDASETHVGSASIASGPLVSTSSIWIDAYTHISRPHPFPTRTCSTFQDSRQVKQQ